MTGESNLKIRRPLDLGAAAHALVGAARHQIQMNPLNPGNNLVMTGESNLKIRRPLDLGAGMVGSAAEAHALVGVLRCEPPNPNLHYFAGRFTYRAPDGPRHSRCRPSFGPGQWYPKLRCMHVTHLQL